MDQVPSVRVVRDTVPEEVEVAILAAMNKVPADRPQTAAQFAELLGAPLEVTASRYSAARLSAARRPSQAAAVPRAGAITLTVRRRSLIGTLAMGALVVAAIGGWLALRGGEGPRPTGGLDPKRIAVLYFGDLSPDGRLGFLADGLTEALIGELSRVPGLSVVSTGGMSVWRDSTITADSVGRAVQAGTLVQGRVEPVGGGGAADRIRVQVWLVDGNSGADLGKRASFERPATDLVGARDSLAAQAADLIRRQLGQEVRLRGQQEGTKSTAAWSLVQRAELLVKRAVTAAGQSDTLAQRRSFDSADSLLAQAEELDPRWADPIVLRARVAYLRSRHSFDDLLAAGRWIAAGMGHVERGLALSPNNPDALELRGNLQYWKYLLRLEQNAAAAAGLRDRARADLEQATRLNPAQAGAWASLSHLYYNDPNTSVTDVMLAARRAYESDAFLSNAAIIVERLFYASYDLDQPVDAAHWCGEGARRFPTESAFTICQIYLMTMRGQDPDPVKGWQLAGSATLTEPYHKAEARMLLAGVLARAGLADSARALARSAAPNTEVDPTRDLYLQQAFVFTLLDDKTAAVEALKTFLAANPERRQSFASDPGWRLRSLTSEPAFKSLVSIR
jgi:serine/threonine-protein kinase